MKGNKILYIVGGLALFVVGILFLRFDLPIVSVSAEKIPHFQLGPIAVTNSLLTSWIVTILIITVAYFGTRNMQLIPSGFQNVLEMIIETLYNLTEGVSGPKWTARFFIIPATIFIYVLVSNWFGLIPGLAGFGVCETHHVPGEDAHHVEEVHHEEDAGFKLGNTCPEGQVIVPFFRSPSADLNNTLMLAIVTQIAAQVFGFMALGFGGYMGKFFVFKGITDAFKPDSDGNARSTGSMIGQLLMGIVELFVGLLELLSEFVKVLAFTFRLFGNIFAGEVMLIVLTFLVPVMLTLPFLGFEVFVGAVQAFIFFILSVAFYNVAVTAHDHEEAH